MLKSQFCKQLSCTRSTLRAGNSTPHIVIARRSLSNTAAIFHKTSLFSSTRVVVDSNVEQNDRARARLNNTLHSHRRRSFATKVVPVRSRKRKSIKY
jgi:hypothetical protein